MIAQIFTRRIASEKLMYQILQGAVGSTAALLFVVGFLRLTALELTEAQLLLGIGVWFSVVLQCGILYVLVDHRRKAA